MQLIASHVSTVGSTSPTLVDGSGLQFCKEETLQNKKMRALDIMHESVRLATTPKQTIIVCVLVHPLRGDATIQPGFNVLEKIGRSELTQESKDGDNIDAILKIQVTRMEQLGEVLLQNVT